MVRILENALYPYRHDLEAFSEAPTLFGNSYKIYYDKRTKWNVEELNIFQRIYYMVLNYFSGTNCLKKENKNTLSAFNIQERGELSNRLFTLLDLILDTNRANPQVPLPRTEEKAPVPDPISIPPTLKRIGNSTKINCWINATLQVLFQLDVFVKTLERADPNHPVVQALQNVYREYFDPRATPASRRRFVERLKEALVDFDPRSFVGSDKKEKLRSEQCPSTALGSIFRVLSLDLTPFLPLIVLDPHISFASSIAKHFETHSRFLDEAPPILTFNSLLASSTGEVADLSGEWDPPLILDLSSKIKGGVYSLLGVISHQGKSTHEGHIVTTLLLEKRFWHINDLRQEIVPVERVSSSNGFTLYELIPS